MPRSQQPRHRRPSEATRRRDVVRRGLVIALVAALLALVPGIAMARFSAVTSPGDLSVGTARLVSPPAVTGTYSCSGTLGEAVSATVSGLTAPNQPAGTTYEVVLYRGGAERDRDAATSGQLTVTSAATFLGFNYTYRVTVQAKLGGWTTTEISRTFSCSGARSGSF